MTEYIEREKVVELIDYHREEYCEAESYFGLLKEDFLQLPSADVQPVVRCKDCKHFHLNYFGEVNGVNIIVAHEICDLWAGGCRTMQNAFCSNGVRKDGEDNG